MRPLNGVTRLASLALLLAALLPRPLHAADRGDAPTSRRYPLFAASYARFLVNRVDYSVNARGEIGVEQCCDFGRRGIWPAGTSNQYLFNSGLQLAGIIGGSRPTNPWAGDTSMGLFFDGSGLRQHGTAVTGVFNALVAGDRRQWPEAARVGDDGGLYPASRQGLPSVSDGDLWWMSWEGDPQLNAARPHPLGVAVEFRMLGWNAPRGIEDVAFVVATIYNVTASDPAAYQAYRPGLRDTLAALGSRFQALNEEKFAVVLPDAGYVIDPLYANVAVDPDVTYSAGMNATGVNLPLAMGYAWHPDFPRAAGWAFPAEIFGPPFFAASGLVGVKYLRTPGATPSIQLYSAFTGGGTFPDPNTAVRAFKYMAGAVEPADGISCNFGPPLDAHICFLNTFAPSDVRFMQSTPATSLAPGAATTVAFAYVHAAPVAIAGFQRGTRVMGGDPTRLSDPVRLAQGANTIDSLAGFAGYADRNGDGVVQPGEFTTVRGSLLQKAQLAQAIFDSHFALPEAPASPDFFLIPGSGEVTVVWRPSSSEATGDPYYTVAHPASVVPPGGGAPVPNPLYDPNYRQFDVEGYRIWRGRTDDPAAMTLVAQYDYDGTVVSDYTGQVSDWRAWPQCAPELGVTEQCAGTFDVPVPGVQLMRHVDHDLVGAVLQVDLGDRTLLPDGSVLVLRADTLISGGGSGLPTLANTGVPFAHVDAGLRNGLTYFYAVTSFDVNAISSTGAGHTSLESARQPQAVTPRSTAPASDRRVALEQGVYGRHGRLTDTEMPTIDPATGRFSKRFPPTDGVTLDVIGVVPQLLAGSDEVSITFDSSATTAFQPGSSIEAVYHYTVHAPAGDAKLRVPVTQSATSTAVGASGRFAALVADPGRLARYGAGTGAFGSEARYGLSFPSGYYGTVRARGCVNHAGGFSWATECAYNGPRWFSGDQETVDDPNASNPDRFNTGLGRIDFNNVGGGLGNVRTIFEPRAYDDYSNTWRDVEAVLLPFQSAADYRVYWGSGGMVDSVVDLTHDVVVPFGEQLGASWGILNQAATQNGASYFDQRSTLTVSDAGCLEPLRTLDPGGIACTGPAAKLARAVIPGPVAYGSSGNTAVDRAAALAPNQGFVLYLKGHLFMVELSGPGLPAGGSSWTLRDYNGVVSGGSGRAGNGGAYTFTTYGQSRPFTAVGSSIRLRYAVEEGNAVASEADLARVHPVPDPYYGGTIDPGAAPDGVTFVNLPAEATVRIYSTSGVLLRVLQHEDVTGGGDALWDLRNRNGRRVASGVYFYHVASPGGAAAVGRMTVITR